MKKFAIDSNNPATYVVSKLNGQKYIRITGKHTRRFGMSIDDYCRTFKVNRRMLVCDDLRRSLSWTKLRAIEMYGEIEGVKRWDEYCRKQAESNTFQYKREKHGMTIDEFKNYNKLRACTLDNFIKRYGEIDGRLKWQNYCSHQAYAGCSVDYFIEKFGDDVGRSVWRDICDRKANSLDNFIRRYGVGEGTKRYNSYTEDRHIFFSKKSQELFKIIDNNNTRTFYATKERAGGEYSVYDDIQNKIYFYDFVDVDLKKCIEFNGDYFHGNPSIFSLDDCPNPYIKTLTCGSIWKYDREKLDCIQRLRGFKTMVVWESDYDANKQQIISDCLYFLKNE